MYSAASERYGFFSLLPVCVSFFPSFSPDQKSIPQRRRRLDLAAARTHNTLNLARDLHTAPGNRSDSHNAAHNPNAWNRARRNR